MRASDTNGIEHNPYLQTIIFVCVSFSKYVIDKEIKMPLLQDDDEELGDLWQDENNMAALLLYKQRGRNQYSLVSWNSF